jgi:hypothetical protein
MSGILDSILAAANGNSRTRARADDRMNLAGCFLR